MMNIQIIKNFSNRTEYKVLKEWGSVDERDVNDLNKGVCVVPAIIFLKLSETELQTLNKWWKQWGNQLIVFPPFHQIDIASLLQLNVCLTVEEVETQSFNNIPVMEVFKTNVRPKWRTTNSEIIALDYYENSGTGCVTLTTLPLLDYRLLSHRTVCTELFYELINENDIEESVVPAERSVIFSPIHAFILILAASRVLDTTILNEQIRKYFNQNIPQQTLTEMFQQLINEKFLESSCVLTSSGEEYLKLNRYQAFVREIKRWGNNDGEWR